MTFRLTIVSPSSCRFPSASDASAVSSSAAAAGVPFDGPWAIAYADGIPRHPAPVYEMLFHWAMGFVLIALWRRQILFGRLFALYLLSYGVFRFLTEFLRETPKAFRRTCRHTRS